MKFLVDMPLSPVLARWLVDKGHDAVHAGEIGMQSAPDTAIMERAKQDARTLITANLDYPRLLALTAAREPSLILFRGGNWSETEVITRIDHLLGTSLAVDIESSVFCHRTKPGQAKTIADSGLTCRTCWARTNCIMR